MAGRDFVPRGRPARLALLVLVGTSACAAPRHAIRPPSLSGQPYLRVHERLAPITVWIVDGSYVRAHLDEEFTNFGQHYRFPFIPRDEFWLDQENAPGEAGFFVEHLRLEHRLMAAGTDYDAALDLANAAGKLERARTPRSRRAGDLLAAGRRSELMALIHKERLAGYGAGVEVWVVDGELVRDLFFIDFTEGGHDRVYDFVPRGEVWIDDDVVPGERRFILLHELHERSLMGRGLRYAEAHRRSSTLELACRRHPERLAGAFDAEIARIR
jgi:hypothetical protein